MDKTKYKREKDEEKRKRPTDQQIRGRRIKEKGQRGGKDKD